MRFSATLTLALLACSCSNVCEKPGLTITPGLSGWQSYLEDPAASPEDVWSVNEGVLRCKGGPRGYLYSKEDFTHFVLEFDWRWPVDQGGGRGGVLIRMTDEHKIWPKSLEAQLNVGGGGDFWGLDGYRLSGPDERMQTMDHETFGRLTHLERTEDRESPVGEWNRYKIIAQGDRVVLELNGETVNEAQDCDVTPGKICLTSEGSGIFFRNLNLLRLEQ